ncbi:hypothetical protein ACMHYB_29630 [Sorangium sp. So ce1128]
MMASLGHVLGCSGGGPSDGSAGTESAASGGSGGTGGSGGSVGEGGDSAGTGGSGDEGSDCKVSEVFPGSCNCVIKQDGSLWCWGAEGCIANDAEDGDELAQITVPGGVLTLDVADQAEALAVNQAGELFYWGGDEPEPIRVARAAAGTEREPVRFPDTPAGIRKVAITNKSWFCVLRDDSDVSCWNEELAAWQPFSLGGGARIVEIIVAPWSV